MVEDLSFAQSFKHLTWTPLVTYTRVTSSDSNENDGLASNGKMIACSWKSTSTVAVFNAEKTMAFDANTPLIKGHQGMIYDMAWSPFEDRLLATCADDGKVKMWVFDDYEGCIGKGNIMDADLILDAHHRKCMGVKWHEAAENLLATHSIDKTIKVWDINEDRCGDAIFTFSDMGDHATSIRWSPDGKMIGSMHKNKTMQFVDPRQEATALRGNGHVGPRQQRFDWVDNQTIITTGFESGAKRQWGAWDLRNLEQPLVLGPLNDGSGVPYFFYDREYSMFIMAGRGDNTTSIYNFDRSSPTILNLVQMNNFLSTTHKAFTIMPKHVVDVRNQEVMRAARVTNVGTLEVLAMRIPSRVGGFNQDYYPPFVANEPSSKAEDWSAGTDVPAKTMQLTAEKKVQVKK